MVETGGRERHTQRSREEDSSRDEDRDTGQTETEIRTEKDTRWKMLMLRDLLRSLDTLTWREMGTQRELRERLSQTRGEMVRETETDIV